MRLLQAVLTAIRRAFYLVWGGTGLLATYGFLTQARDNKNFYGTLSLGKNFAGLFIIFLAPLSVVWLAARGLTRE